MRRPALLSCLTIATALLLPSWRAEAADDAAWSRQLAERIARIDQQTPGRLGVYVKRLSDGSTMNHGTEQAWYLASMAKVPVALAVLRQVQLGKAGLGDEMALQDGDRIDVGNIVWNDTGTRYSVRTLVERMLLESDNTAANMLIRSVGEDALNDGTRQAMGTPNVTLTTFAQVRRDVYAEVHPKARELDNRTLVRIASARNGPARVEAIRRAVDVPRDQLATASMDEAYDRYYRRNLNTATLQAYGGMLERLVRGQLLPEGEPRTVLYKAMKRDIYTGYRLQAGLPRDMPFIHKTGTQHRRACHAGVLNPDDLQKALVIVACTADLDEQKQAGPVLESVGRAIRQVVLSGKA
ncbi:serine hydrolase [uncultured Pseudacidovorax sp.]|uniref:serine hydrolase n=1 Tax=uncultured Pseudacidovorax sp. TaxID=679313 RepID=UPI0025CE2E66|nr:serine hydrolase [uncultured Pseudacidovorax sp.]